MTRIWRGAIFAAGTVLAAGATACFGDLVQSVWFNSTKPDLALPPSPLVVRTWDEAVLRNASAVQGELFDVPEDEKERTRRERVTNALAQAERALDADPSRANLLAAASAARAKAALRDEGEDSARDRAEAYTLVARRPTRLLRAYRKMRARVDDGTPGPSSAALAGDPLEGNLLYLAALRERGARRLALLEAAARDLDSPRRQPALMMIARELLADDRPSAAAIARARMAMAQVKEPRFAWTLLGWRARADLLSGSPAKALAGYLRQFDAPPTTAGATNAAASIRIATSRLGTAGAAAFRAEVRRDPTILRPYLAYRVRHTNLTAADRIGLYRFVREFGGGGPVGADLRARLAEMAMLAGDPAAARRDAQAAIAAGTRQVALANYVLGGLAMRSGETRDAEGYFRKAAAAPLSSGQRAYAIGAKEPLALILERTGRRGEALDIYRELEYSEDQAWLLDIRMTPAEIEAYEKTLGTANSEWRDLVRYSLGMRYLRLDRFDDAERAFLSLGPRLAKLAQEGSRDYAWFASPAGANTDALFNPLQTARDLRDLNRAVSQSGDAEARSAARYELASYYYTRRNLLLYNAPLWRGGRAWDLGVFWNETIARPEDRQARVAAAYEHEALQRARAILLRIIEEDGEKGTATTPKAMYRAATAERRLADLNPQWRDIARFKEDLWASASARLDALAERFPDDPLAADARKFAEVFRREAKGEAEGALVGDDPTSRLALIRSRR